MPHTPDPYSRISKRAFDRELASWRRGLHVCSAKLGSDTSVVKVGAATRTPLNAAAREMLAEEEHSALDEDL